MNDSYDDDRLVWGWADKVPPGVPAAWGCRAIDQGSSIDIVWDRVDCIGPEDQRGRLRTMLADRVPPARLEQLCVPLAYGAEEIVHDDDELVVAARKAGGYVHVAAWLSPPVGG